MLAPAKIIPIGAVDGELYPTSEEREVLGRYGCLETVQEQVEVGGEVDRLLLVRQQRNGHSGIIIHPLQGNGCRSVVVEGGEYAGAGILAGQPDRDEQLRVLSPKQDIVSHGGRYGLLRRKQTGYWKHTLKALRFFVQPHQQLVRGKLIALVYTLKSHRNPVICRVIRLVVLGNGYGRGKEAVEQKYADKM